MLTGNDRTATYTSFDMPVTISKSGASDTFVYGPEHQSSASPSMTQSAAAVIETPADHSANPTTNLTELGAVIEEHTEDSEPVPMSLDRVASDRTFDRQLAYLGLLDDAAPIFRDGSQVPGVGVLLALPCLIESGLLSIARKLYGEIGPAFYGLRTTLLTLMLMALLRIQRPEHLKERDPAGFGRLLTRKQPNIVRALLAQWCTNVLRSKVEPMKEVAHLIRNHFEGILSWVSTRQTNGSPRASVVTEGLQLQLRAYEKTTWTFLLGICQVW